MSRTELVVAILIITVGFVLGGFLGYLLILRPVTETPAAVGAVDTPTFDIATPPMLSLPPTISYTTYVVQTGDNLWTIADRFDTTVEAIMELNGLSSTLIYSGTELYIPGGEIPVLSLMITATPSDRATPQRPTMTPSDTATPRLPTTIPSVRATPQLPTPTPIQPSLGTASSPVPRGQGWLAPDGWQIMVLDFDPDAWPVFPADSQFGDPPAAGNRMVMVRVGVTNISVDDEPAVISDFWFYFVGSRNVVYSTFGEHSCGVIPDSLYGDLYRGGHTEGNVCFQIPIDETDLRLLYEYSWQEYVYFEVQ